MKAAIRLLSKEAQRLTAAADKADDLGQSLAAGIGYEQAMNYREAIIVLKAFMKAQREIKAIQ